VCSFISIADIKVDGLRDIDYLMQGKKYLENQRYAIAVYYFSKVIELNANYLSAYYYKYIALKELGEL